MPHTRAKSERQSPESSSGRPLSPKERHRMIAEAAYFRAQSRGFRAGDPVDDWLAAEAEIDRRFKTTDRTAQAYQRLREQVQQRLSEVRDTVNADTVRNAVNNAAKQLRGLGEYSSETINQAAATLRKDIAAAAQRLGPRWDAFTDRSGDVFDVWRDRSSTFLARAANGVGEWLQRAGSRLNRPLYQSGEIAASGEFECQRCHGHVALKESGPVPDCPQCGPTTLRRL